MPLVNLKFVEAYRAAHPIQAHALRMALEEAGIRVIIENEALQGAIGDVPAGWSSAPKLMVEESQLAAARTIISQTDHSERANLGLKPHETAIALGAASFGILGVALAPDGIEEPESPETTRCLACDAIMTESEATCPNCGWTYESDSATESEETDASNRFRSG